MFINVSMGTWIYVFRPRLLFKVKYFYNRRCSLNFKLKKKDPPKRGEGSNKEIIGERNV
jgi:hypothetical protein